MTLMTKAFHILRSGKIWPPYNYRNEGDATLALDGGLRQPKVVTHDILLLWKSGLFAKTLLERAYFGDGRIF